MIYKGDDNYYLEGTSPNSSRPAMGGILEAFTGSLWAWCADGEHMGASGGDV